MMGPRHEAAQRWMTEGQRLLRLVECAARAPDPIRRAAIAIVGPLEAASDFAPDAPLEEIERATAVLAKARGEVHALLAKKAPHVLAN